MDQLSHIIPRHTAPHGPYNITPCHTTPHGPHPITPRHTLPHGPHHTTPHYTTLNTPHHTTLATIIPSPTPTPPPPSHPHHHTTPTIIMKENTTHSVWSHWGPIHAFLVQMSQLGLQLAAGPFHYRVVTGLLIYLMTGCSKTFTMFIYIYIYIYTFCWYCIVYFCAWTLQVLMSYCNSCFILYCTNDQFVKETPKLKCNVFFRRTPKNSN